MENVLPVGPLLVVDRLPHRPPKTEGLMLLFDGGVLTDAVTHRFVLPADELVAWRFFAVPELAKVLPGHTARRLRLAIELLGTGTPGTYLEHGWER